MSVICWLMFGWITTSSTSLRQDPPLLQVNIWKGLSCVGWWMWTQLKIQLMWNLRFRNRRKVRCTIHAVHRLTIIIDAIEIVKISFLLPIRTDIPVPMQEPVKWTMDLAQCYKILFHVKIIDVLRTYMKHLLSVIMNTLRISS